MACITVERDGGPLDDGAGFKALPRLDLPRNIVVLKCSWISKFHSRGIVTLFWFIKFTFLNVPSSIIILGRDGERKRAFLNTEENNHLLKTMTSLTAHCLKSISCRIWTQSSVRFPWCPSDLFFFVHLYLALPDSLLIRVTSTSRFIWLHDGKWNMGAWLLTVFERPKGSVLGEDRV